MKFKCLEKNCGKKYTQRYWADQHAEQTGHRVVERDYGQNARKLQADADRKEQEQSEVVNHAQRSGVNDIPISKAIKILRVSVDEVTTQLVQARELLESLEHRL